MKRVGHRHVGGRILAMLLAAATSMTSVPGAGITVHAEEQEQPAVSENGITGEETPGALSADEAAESENSEKEENLPLDITGDSEETEDTEETEQIPEETENNSDVGQSAENTEIPDSAEDEVIGNSEDDPETVTAAEEHMLVYTINDDGTHSAVCTDLAEDGTPCDYVIDHEIHVFTDGVCVCGAEEKEETLTTQSDSNIAAADSDYPNYYGETYTKMTLRWSHDCQTEDRYWGDEYADEYDSSCIVVHEGECVGVSFFCSYSWEEVPGELDYRIEAGTSSSDRESGYQLPEAELYKHAYDGPWIIRGVSTSERYLRLAQYVGDTLIGCIPIKVLPAEQGVVYDTISPLKKVTVDEITSNGELDIGKLKDIFSEDLRKREGTGFYLITPASCGVTVYNLYEALFKLYGRGTDQSELAVDEGDYLAEEGYYGVDAWDWYHYETPNMLGDASYFYQGQYYNGFNCFHDESFTTPEMEQIVSDGVHELCTTGELSKYQSADRYTQVKACQAWVEGHVTYSQNGMNYNLDNREYWLSAASAYIDGKADCRGYALLFYRLLKEFGIPSRLLVKTTSPHIWNLVYMDDTDKWYSCDASQEGNCSILLKGTDSYSLDGHHKEEGAEEYANTAYEDNIIANVSKTDYQAPKSYTITFNGNGGTPDYNSKKLVSGKSYGELPEAERTGYTFSGWYTDAKAGKLITSDTKADITANQKLYAHWIANTYTLTLDAGEEGFKDRTLGTSTTLTVTYDGTYPDMPEPVRTGYTFKNWAESDGTAVLPGNKVTIAEETTLTPVWEINKYTVTLHGNGGYFSDGDILTLMAEHGESLSELTFTAPVRAGIKQDENTPWTMDEAGEDVYDLTTPVTKDGIELYAHWSSEYSQTVCAVQAEVMRAGTVINDDGIKSGDGIRLKTTTDQAAIYYTTAEYGTPEMPTVENGTRYTGLIEVDSNLTIRAIAVRTGFNDSEVSTFSYKLMDTSEDTGDVLEEDIPDDTTMPPAMRAAGIPSGLWIAWVNKADDYAYGQKYIQEYTGSAIKPAVRVYYGKKLLTAAKDYTCTYGANTKPGQGTVKIQGKNNYTGTYTASFTITERNISSDIENLDDITVAYNAKKAQIPAFSLKVSGKKLTLGKDYSYEIYTTEDVDLGKSVQVPGTYRVEVQGCGNYTGSGSFLYTILKEDQIQVSTLSVDKIADQSYTAWFDSDTGEFYDPADVEHTSPKNGIEPGITVRNKARAVIDPDNYVLTYAQNRNAGKATVTITGTGEIYTGSKTVTFNIKGINMSAVTVSGLTGKNAAGQNITYTYTGNAIEPAGAEDSNSDLGNVKLTYTVKKGTEPDTLVKGTDYTVTYQNNINAGNGKAAVIFTGRGKYTGTLKKTFSISAYNMSSATDVSKLDVTFFDPDATENGYVAYDYIKNGVTPKVVVSFDGAVLEEGKDYQVKYENNKTAAAANAYDAKKKKNVGPSITIIGKGNFTGKYYSMYFTIRKRDIAGVVITAADRVASTKANSYAVTPVLTDPNNTKNPKLTAGTDYAKTLVYTYEYDTEITRYNSKTKKTIRTAAAAGTTVGKSDIIPAGTTIRVTAAGINNYTGTVSTTYRIDAYDIAKATVKVADQTYDGHAVTPGKGDIQTITYKIGKTNVPIENYDYEIVSYSKNTGKGTASMTIHGLGNYCGYKTVTFKIKEQSINAQAN